MKMYLPLVRWDALRVHSIFAFSILMGVCLGGWSQEAVAEQLSVRSTPGGSILYINGTRRGRTPFTATLPAGRYHVEVRRAGYLTWSTYLLLPQRSELRLRAKLERSSGSRYARSTQKRLDDVNRIGVARPKRGGLLIAKTEPSGVAVYSGSQFLGRTPLLKFLASGEHTLRFEQPGLRTVVRRVRISSAKSVRLNLQLAAGLGRPSRRGADTSRSSTANTQLMILSKPSAHVFLGSRNLGKTPVITAGIAPGTYKLVMKRKGYLPYQRLLVLHAGQQLRIRARLVRKR